MHQHGPAGALAGPRGRSSPQFILGLCGLQSGVTVEASPWFSPAKHHTAQPGSRTFGSKTEVHSQTDRAQRPAAAHHSAQKPAARHSTVLGVRRTADGQAWELLHPRCARYRAEDLEEVQKMIDAGEAEIATDELHWLLNGCSDYIDAHRMLGEIAMADDDLALTHGHFGYVHQLGMKALQQAKTTGPLPYRLPANQGFHEGGKGLVYCLLHLGKRKLASEVAEQLLQCDPSDPLAVRALLGAVDGPPE